LPLDVIRSHPSVTNTEPNLVPHPHQMEVAQAILAARQAGKPGFLLGDETGMGKTLGCWLGVAQMPEQDVLIICPKGAIPQWRRTIRLSGMPAKTVTITNFEKTKSLFKPVQGSLKRSVRAKNREHSKFGVLKQAWPIVIIDEAHRIRNPFSQQGMCCRRITEGATFTVYLSATAGQKPHDLSYLGSLLSHAAGVDTSGMDGFRTLMRRLKIGKAKGRWKNWSWDPNERDRRVMSDLLYKGANAIGMRRRPADVAGWPEIARNLAPTSLTASARRLYETSWFEFRRQLGLAGGSTRRPAGRTAELRYRQKASLLRVPGTEDFVKDLLEQGNAVAISVAFLETSAALVENLRASGWRVDSITGTRSGEENEAARMAFQTGELDAIVFTVTESISLHQNEHAGGDRPRHLVVHDMRHSAIQLRQIEGRCHRDGRHSTVWYVYAEDTVEEGIAALVIERMAAMDGMAGDDTDLIDRISALIEHAIQNR
jgi:hypothetical protein